MHGQRLVEINPHIDVATHEANRRPKMVVFPYLQAISITEAMFGVHLNCIWKIFP